MADPPESSGTVEAELSGETIRIGGDWRGQLVTAAPEVQGVGRFRRRARPERHNQGSGFRRSPRPAEREYNLAVYAHREGPVAVKVTFTNEETGEYMHYDVVVTVTAPDIIDTVIDSVRVQTTREDDGVRR